MRKLINGIKIVCVVLIAIFITWVNYKKYSSDDDLLGLITNSIAVLIFLIPTIYHNINIVFIYTHKVLVHLINPQVNCTGKFSITIDEIDFIDFSNKFRDNVPLEDVRYTQLGNKTIFEHRYGSFDLIYDETYKTINLYFPLSMSYRDSKKNFLKKYFKLCDLLIDNFKNESPVYEVAIDFKGYNPFHRLFIKKFDETEVDYFKLELKDRDCNITILENQIHIISPDREKIYSVMKEYIAHVVIK